MAYICAEGFECFTGGDSATILNGNLVNGASVVSGVALSSSTRFSYGRAASCSTPLRYRQAVANRTKVYQGVALQRTTANNTATIFEVYDGATLQCHLQYDSTLRQVSVYRGSGTGNLIAQSAEYVGPVLGDWFYLEWCPLIDPSTGTIEVRLNGSNVVISASGLNTRASAASQITMADLVLPNDSFRWWVDDYYLFDDQGSANNNFNGDSRVYTSFPDTDNVVQFTPSTGAVNADNVDEIGDVDDDTTYNESGTVGHKDSFNDEQIPSSALPQAIEVRFAARKTDVAAHTMRANLERAGNTANGTTRTLATSYAFWVDRHENDPTDASSLTAAKINAMHLQYEVVS